MHPGCRIAANRLRPQFLEYQHDQKIDLFRSNCWDEVTGILWFELGMAYLGQEKFPEAIDALKNTTLLDPTDFEAWSDLGLMCANNNQIEEAEDAYQHALTLNDHEAQVWMFYARFVGKGKPPRKSVSGISTRI